MRLPFSKLAEENKKPLVQNVAKESFDPTKVTVEPLSQLGQGMVSVQDVIAPGAIEIDFDHLKIGNKYFRSPD
jgi:hypothetical protein